MKIAFGPFKDVEPTQDELRPMTDRLGVQIVRDGVPVHIFGVHHRTQRFLDVFDPLKGFAVEVTSEMGKIELPDPDTYVDDGNGGQRMAIQPTVLFKAFLRDPEQRLIATAEFLKIINSASSFSEGHSQVRGKLYEALGLPGSTSSEDAPRGEQKQAPAPVTGTAHVNGVSAISTPAESSRNKLPAEAQALLEQAKRAGAQAAPAQAQSDAQVVTEAKEATGEGSDTAALEVAEAPKADVTASTVAKQSRANAAPAKSGKGTAKDAATPATTDATNEAVDQGGSAKVDVTAASEAEVVVEATPTQAPTPTVASAAPAAIQGVPSAPKAANGEELNANLLRQARNRAQAKGVPVPDVFDSALHLRNFYKQLCTNTQASAAA